MKFCVYDYIWLGKIVQRVSVFKNGSWIDLGIAMNESELRGMQENPSDYASNRVWRGKEMK